MNSMIQEQAVRRFIRRRDTGEFFNGAGWTNNPREAMTCSDVVEAAQICVRHQLTGVELALRVHAEASDVFCLEIR